MQQPREPQAEGELLAAGNRPRFRAVPGLLGSLGLGIFASAAPFSARWMVPLVAFAVAAATLSVLDLLGTFDDPTDAPEPSARDLLLPSAVVLGATALFVLVLRAAVAGTIAPALAGVAMPATVIAWLVGAFRVGERLGPLRVDENGKPRPLHRRHGFWLLSLATLLYLPTLGLHSLTDPWEPHYGEVAREILARRDWVSLWWAEDGWFWSKPVLTFWLQAIFMVVAGVRYEPGRMLSAVGEGQQPWPEWALRMPCFLLTLVGVYVLYRGVMRGCGRRAAFLGGVALLTMPQFFLVARQAMTDMPFVACLMAATGLLLSGAATDPGRVAVAYDLPLGRRPPRVSLFHLVVGAILVVALAQIIYLASRNLHIALSPRFDIRFVADTLTQGSPGNCDVPTNARCEEGLPTAYRVQPIVQALIWLQGMGLFLWLSWGERRVKRLLYLGAWMFAALATMAKGMAGLGLPVLSMLLWVAATRRWRELVRLEIVAGLLTFSVCALPWILAMWVRHGPQFVNDLLLDHMVRRAFGEMHQTNVGDEASFRYYVWQLGYATFPWVGLAPVALVAWLRRAAPREARWQACCLLAAMFLVGFAVFTLMGTKFHHYCLPIVPPLAMLVGVLLDDLMTEGALGDLGGAIAIGAALLTFAVGMDFALEMEGRPSAIRLLHLFTYRYTRLWPEELDYGAVLWGFTGVAALATAGLAWERRRRIGVALLGCVAGVFALWAIDVYMQAVAPHWGQRELLVAYERLQPEEPGRLVAFQLNWKGENFYRGNSVATFKVSGQKFQDFIDACKRDGERTFYFITEHQRAGALHAELGSPHVFDRLTDERLNNKFVLIRASFSETFY